MKTKITFLVAALFLAFNFVAAQEPGEEDILTLSQLDQSTKNKNFDEAYKYLNEIRNRNPKYSLAIYTNGDKVLKALIKKSSGTDKATLVNDLIKLYEQRSMHYASRTPKGQYMAKIAQLLYDNRKILNKTDQELYDKFDSAYKTDLKTFKNPQSIYTYFKLAVKLYDKGSYSAENLFTKYDEVSEKVESEVKNYTNELNKFNSEKGLTGNEDNEDEKLSRRDKSKLNSYNSYLRGYAQIVKGMDSDLGIRANCENLIPLYERNYDENKDDGVWLQRAMNRLYAKECTDSELFVKIVEQKNTIEPDANTAYYLGILKDKIGDAEGALVYYKQAIELETDSFEKAKILERLAGKLKKAKKYSQARKYYREALKENPSLGRAYLAIAQMYAASANSCGDNSFDKRATYWYAVQEARKGARVDANMRSLINRSIANWSALAPARGDIFSQNKQGTTINLKCWIGASVKVPNL
ncbi:hypothetical protein D7030_00185 [Flavobacteriaceae bacterium AU392]|nr:hypothetical protein D1817_14250 [Flavobacteriaceae bacterium]RKM86951.1 hypothetical protein D7030_00185 [Flavobacteriaceae bacterium AU392]